MVLVRNNNPSIPENREDKQKLFSKLVGEVSLKLYDDKAYFEIVVNLFDRIFNDKGWTNEYETIQQFF